MTSSLLHSLKPLSLRCACMSHNLQDRQISPCRCHFWGPWNQEAFDLSAMLINWSCLLVWAYLGKNLEWYTSVFIPDTQCLSEYTFSQWRNLLSSKTCGITWAPQSSPCLADSKPTCVCPCPVCCFVIWYVSLDAYLHRRHLPACDSPVSA